MARPEVHDFRQPTINKLAKRAGHHCSNPDCQAPTSGPSAEHGEATSSIGEAAHIKGAAPGARRYDPNLSAEECRGFENGIWLCRNCATKIDRDEVIYTVVLLRAWKKDAEERARVRQGKPLKEIARDEYEPEHQKIMTALLVDKDLKIHAQLLKEKDIQVSVVDGEVRYIPGESIDFHFSGNLDTLHQAINQAMTQGEFDLNLEASGLTFATVDASLRTYFPPVNKGMVRIEPETQEMQFFLASDTDHEVLSGSVKKLYHPNRLRIEIANATGAIKIIFMVPDKPTGSINVNLKYELERGVSEQDVDVLRALWMITNHEGRVTLSDPKTRRKFFQMHGAQDLTPELRNMGKFAKLTELYFEVLEHLGRCSAIMNRIDPVAVMADATPDDFRAIVELYNGIQNGLENSFSANVDAGTFKDSLRDLSLNPSAKYWIELYVPVKVLGTILTVARLKPEEPKLTLLDMQSQQPITLTTDQFDSLHAMEVTLQVEGNGPFEFIQDSKIQVPTVRFVLVEP